MSKYVNSKDNTVHCPSCRGVLFREVNFENPEKTVSFKMRCPHCQKYATVTIDLDSNKIIIDDNG